MEIHWQRLVDTFELHKEGASPWDAKTLEANIPGSSEAEKQAILFLLHAWDPGGGWPEKFDFFEAFPRWDATKQKAFLAWCKDPLWP